MSEEWIERTGISKPTYEQLEAFCVQLADENARLRRQLALADGVRSVQYDGVRVFITEDAPPIIWNGKEATVLEFGEVVEALHVALKEPA